jgi:hypothetical protein
MRIIALLITADQKIGVAADEHQLLPPDACKRFEGGACRPTAVGTMAIRRIDELVRENVRDRTTKALSRQHPRTHEQTPATSLFALTTECRFALPSRQL